MKIEVIVLNFNGGNLLGKCLPSLHAAVGRSTHNAKLVLLDNGSTDSSDDDAKAAYPDLKLVQAKQNRILCSYNDYLSQSDCDIAILLNNDIKVEEDFIDPLVRHFQARQDLFMVTPKCLSFDGSHYEGGITRFRMKFGIFWASSRYPGHEEHIKHTHFTMAAGYGAFDRKKFVELGGYDDLYLPGRLEDSDLCLRAWRRGWVLLYEPSSIIYHEGGVAFHKKFGESGTLKMNHRNSFLFVWKNIQSPVYLVSHLIFLPIRLLAALLRGQKEFVQGFFDALPLLGEALKRRRSNPRHHRSDQEIFLKV